MKLKLNSKVIPVGIIATIAAFSIMYTKDGHNHLNISAIKGSLADMKGIYAEVEDINGKNTKVNYTVGKDGSKAKLSLMKQSTDSLFGMFNKVGKDDNDMIAYIGIDQGNAVPATDGTVEVSQNRLVVLKAKDKKYIPEKDLNKLENENKVGIEEIDSTKYEKVIIPLKRSVKSGAKQGTTPTEFLPSLDYVYRKNGNIHAFISYILDDGSTQFEELKINPENLSIISESKFNFKGTSDTGIVIYDTFMKNGKLVYFAEDSIPEKANAEKILFIKYDLAKKGYSSNYVDDLKLGDTFDYTLNGEVLNFRGVKSSKNGKKLNKYILETFEYDTNTMKVKNLKEFKTDLKISDYDFPIHSTYVDDKNVAYMASDSYTINAAESNIYGLSVPSTLKILDKNTGELKFEGKVQNTAANYTNNTNMTLKGEGYNE